ncbi:repulsive guidance molecule B-like [Bacillus rossius redtenbacheri]|uniref:repulsive guidance molecule B-like n=1 Tax=Bacillus rossius redtenbacheri TaxID=93214 RepID=UPI002FDE2FEB
MDRGPPPRLSAPPPPPPPLLLLRLLALLLLMAGRCGACRVEQCSSEYGDHQKLQDFKATPESCRLAYAYLRCLRETARACRGDISFHFASSWLDKKVTQNGCAALLRVAATQRSTTASGEEDEEEAAWTPEASTSAAMPPPPPTPPPHCAWRGRRRFRHCGLFGDPHLKTFHNEYQTCRVRGAWPLVDNPYLAVQVTNEPVVEGSPATATTKVTVIVRGKDTNCTPEKTYEAQSDAPLPGTFIDGTRQSGPDRCVLLTVHDGGERVEISALHVAGTVVVRRSGRYLAVAARLPEELALGAAAPGALQLCARGCPAAERLDASPPSAAPGPGDDGRPLPWEAALARCRRSPGLAPPYLDWCAFDLMTTAADEFVAAARSAQEDVMRLDPGSLDGNPPGVSSSSSSSSSLARSWAAGAVAILAALAAAGA